VRRLFSILAVLLVACGSATTSSGLAGYGGLPPGEKATYTYVVPYGTAVQIERGYRVDIMPTSLDVKVGESIRVINKDNTTFAVGPFTVAAGHEVSMRFTNPGVLSGVCAVNAAGRFEIRVSA
jgi:hypothetical protein